MVASGPDIVTLHHCSISSVKWHRFETKQPLWTPAESHLCCRIPPPAQLQSWCPQANERSWTQNFRVDFRTAWQTVWYLTNGVQMVCSDEICRSIDCWQGSSSHENSLLHPFKAFSLLSSLVIFSLHPSIMIVLELPVRPGMKSLISSLLSKVKGSQTLAPNSPVVLYPKPHPFPATWYADSFWCNVAREWLDISRRLSSKPN